jgi:hypothetical protein
MPFPPTQLLSRNRALPRFLSAVTIMAILGATNNAAAHPLIKRWSYQATINRIYDPDGLFPDVRLGNQVTGWMGFDASRPSIPGRFAAYDFALSFPVASAAVEISGTGEVLNFQDDLSIGVTLLDDFLPIGSPLDVMRFSQHIFPPPQDAYFNRVMIEFQGQQAIESVDLPSVIDLDDWETAVVYLTGALTDTQFVAEIHTITSVDEPLLVGDFTGDLRVTSRDLDVWRYAFGSINDNLAADANGDNRVDGADFLVWQRQLGSTAPSMPAPAIPEPGALALVFLAIAGLRRVGGCRRRPRSP